MKAKMIGRYHGPQCDCHTNAVSGLSGKCHKRYGIKRQRQREKMQWIKESAKHS